MSEPNKDLAEHCRFAHITALTVSVAVLLALSADPDRKILDALSEVSLIQSIQERWGDMKGRLADEVERAQGSNSRYIAHGTVTIEDEPVDFAFNVDLTGMWVPHHKHLYQRDESHYHTNRIAHGGSNVDDFADRWNWVTDCIWIYVPNSVEELVTVNRALVGNKWITIDNTVPVTVTKVEKFSNDRLLGTSKRLVVIDLARDLAGGLRFGEFPSEHPIQAGKAHITIRGSIGKPPPAYRQVELVMHLHQESAATTWNRDGTQASKADPNKSIKRIEFKLPTNGEFVDVSPLPILGAEIGKSFNAGERFAARFPNVSRLHESYRTIDVPHLAGILTEQKLSAQDRVLEVVGLKIPFTVVARWGVLITFAVYLYFSVHAFTLLTRLQSAPEDTGWQVAWMVLYRDRFSQVVATITAVVIPSGAAILYFWLAPVPSRTFDCFVMYGAILAIIGISVVVAKTLFAFFRLTRTA